MIEDKNMYLHGHIAVEKAASFPSYQPTNHTGLEATYTLLTHTTSALQRAFRKRSRSGCSQIPG